MAETTPHSKVIRQNDDSLPPHLDFNRLREEGLLHIGNLSGKIWTDHNTHDPGITTLEVLCYALLDLGYRSSLPIEDLLAQKDGEQDDNFFTPAEILSCNPVTITDYRKLLLEIDGVRNAWLEPVEKRNPQLYLDTKTGQLCCCKCDTEVSSPKTEQVPSDNKAKNCGCKKSHDDTIACIDLNGLYHVYLELEKDLFEELEQEKEQEKKCWEKCEQAQAGFDLEKCVIEARKTRTAFFKQVQCVLSAHRNLCEDFEDITILCPQKVGLCAEVEVLPGTDADKVYAEILRRLTDYISPTARFYSLQALLEKGTPIEEIFAGRPHSLKSVFEKGLQESSAQDICASLFDNTAEAVFQSFGFIDTEELENISLKKELHLSDLYSVIHSVEGVYSVKNLCVNSIEKGVQQGSDNPKYDCSDDGISQSKWRFQLFKDTVPVFVLDDLVNGIPLTNIQFSTTTGVIPVNKKKVHAELTRYRKSRLSDEFLNTAIPSGIFREDLDDYISIQNDFPRVYGIGDTGLPESASLLRRTQALQFQGYLLFYDQLLADYLQQLNHLRDLFSLQQESLRPATQRHSAYSATLNPDLTPGINKLVRLLAAKDQGIMEGAVMALPVLNNANLENALCKIEASLNGKLVVTSPGGCYETESNSCDEMIGPAEFRRAFRRDSALNNIRRALDKKQYQIDIRRDNAGWFFLLRFESVNSLVLIGTGRYEFVHEAESAARLTAFLGTWEQNLNKARYENSSAWQYTFQVVSRSIDYALFLQDLAENESAYLKRRESFLDHLLSRFSEKFTEYAAMMFGQIQDEHTRRRRTVEDKSRFLSNYDDISRNRGRSFDYLQASWGTQNISGFERRAMALAGFSDDHRRSLCNVEVYEKIPPFEVVLDDWFGASLLVSQEPIPARTTGEKVAAALHQTLKSGNAFVVDYDPEILKYSLSITAGYIRFQYPGLLESEFDAMEKGRQIKALFVKKSGEENVQISSYAYTQGLRDRLGEVRIQGERLFVSDQEAASPGQVNEFIETINNFGNDKKSTLEAWKLLPIEGSNHHYLNIASFNYLIEPCPTKFKWYFNDAAQKKYLPSAAVFFSEQSALDDFIENRMDKNAVFMAGDGFIWEVALEGNIALQSASIFANTIKSTTAWRQAKEWGTNPKNYSTLGTGATRFRIQLHNDKGGLIAYTDELDSGLNNPETVIAACLKVFENKKIRPKTTVHENCWCFSINNDDDEALLSSYNLYPTAPTALNAWQEAHNAGAIASRYVKSGDETNMNYIFLLKDRQNNFIAEIPQAFDNPSERNKAHQAALQLLKKRPLPLLINAEPPTWAFHLHTENKPLLQALEEYDSVEAAYQGFLTFLMQLTESGSARTSKGVIQTDAVKVSTIGGDANRVLEQVAEIVRSQLFTFEAIKTASGYRFYYFWDSPEGKYEPLFESIREFDSIEDAEKAYNNFAGKLHLAQLNVEGEGQTKSLTVSIPGEKSPVARTINDAVAQQTAVQQFITYASTHLADPLESYSAWVHPTAVGARQYGFRLLKKGAPFAVLACNKHLDQADNPDDDIPCFPPLTKPDKIAAQSCFEPVPLPDNGDYYPRRACYPREEAEKNRYDQCIKKPTDYTWLDVCIGTTDIIQKPTGENCICKYHFVVKGRIGKGTMSELFHSILGYDTEALAIAAYQEQFLEILQVASCEENYGPGKKICTEDCFNILPDDCGKIGDFIAAIAPEFEKDIPKLVEWAKSFPVRYFDVWGNGIKIRKYYFRLFDKDADRFEWQSWACYDTFEKAWQGFMKLLQLLACGDNCRIGAIETGCENHGSTGQKFQVEIREVLVTSQWSYASEDEAWGRDADCDEPIPSCPCDAPFKCPEDRPQTPSMQLSSGDFVVADQMDDHKSVTIPGKNRTDQAVEIKDCCCKIAVHSCCYPPAFLDPNQTGDITTLFLQRINNVLKANSFEGGILREGDHFFATVNVAQNRILPCDYFVKGVISYSSEAEAKIAAGQIMVKLKAGSYQVKILYDSEQDKYSFSLYDDCCQYGAERFLFAAQGDQAFFPYEETDLATDTVKYGFYVVDECYRVAVHPCWYDTEVEAQAALEDLKKPLPEEIEQEAYLLNGKYYVRLKHKTTDVSKPVIQPCGCADDEPENFECDTLFTSTKSFDSEPETLKYTSNIFEIIKKIKAGDKRYEYRIVSETDCGPYSIELVDTCCILGKTPCLFEDKYTRDSTLALAKECTLAEGMHLLEHILLRPCVDDCAPKESLDRPCPGEARSVQPCNPCLLQGCPDTTCSLCWVDNPLEKDPCEKAANPPISYYPLADLYSFWATLVLPAWMKRFHDEDARAFFQHVLYQEAPAHIALNIIWLSPRQLCKFEEVYQRWLAWMQCPVNGLDCSQMPGCCQEEQGHKEDGSQVKTNDCNLRCCMVQTLTSLQPYSWCAPGPGEGEKACGCGQSEVAVPNSLEKTSSKPHIKVEAGKIVNLFGCYYPQTNSDFRPQTANLRVLDEPLPELPDLVLSTAEVIPATEVPAPFVEIEKPVLSKQKAGKKPPLSEQKATPGNGNAANRQFNNRMNERKLNAAALEGQFGEPQIYDRLANSFLSGDGQFSEFKKHVEYLLERTPDLSLEQLPEVVLLKNATWHLLDKMINKEAEGQPFSNEKDLNELLKRLKSKGFNLKAVGDTWDESEQVSKVFGKKQVSRLVKMLKK
jgi:hypothetical protein